MRYHFFKTCFIVLLSALAFLRCFQRIEVIRMGYHLLAIRQNQMDLLLKRNVLTLQLATLTSKEQLLSKSQ